jgi:hypothetical protein
MKWERPDLVEIGMNAEIGGYQSDFGDSEPAGPRGPIVKGIAGTAIVEKAAIRTPDGAQSRS